MTSCLQKLFARVSGVRFISFFCSFFIARLPSSLTSFLSSSSSWLLLLLPSTFSSYHLAFHCYREKHNERITSVPNFCINFPTTTTTTKKMKRVSAVPIFYSFVFFFSFTWVIASGTDSRKAIAFPYLATKNELSRLRKVDSLRFFRRRHHHHHGKSVSHHFLVFSWVCYSC